MVDVTPLVKEGQQIIQSYAGGRFRVSGLVYQGAVIIWPDRVLGWGFDGGLDDLSVSDFDAVTGAEDGLPDVVLLGCGAEMRFLPKELRLGLKEVGLNVEVMDTGAACRTYNVLMAEGRRVVAALLPF